MTAFCVFGITRAQCKKIAEEKTSTYSKELKRDLTKEEFTAKVEQVAKELFESGGRIKQISPAFDAPQFAEDWIHVGTASGQIRDPRIMKRGVKTDKHGNLKTSKKTGLAIVSWIPL